jgi:hypothetical protein
MGLEVYFVREQDNKISQQLIDNSVDKYDETTEAVMGVQWASNGLIKLERFIA